MTSYTLLRRTAYTAAVLSFALIVLGGIVRISGSGMGCGEHWPKCNGEWFPPLDLPTFIEIFHRWVAALVSVAVLVTGAVAWRRHRHEPRLLVPATLAVVLLITQVVLGAVTVKLELPPAVVIVHFVNALLLLTAVLVTALRATPEGATPHPLQSHPLHRLAWITALTGFATVILGAYVANLNAGPACLGFPLCRGGILPPPNPLAHVHLTHRIVAYAFFFLLVALVGRATKRTDAESRGFRLSAAAALLLAVIQIGIAAAMVLTLLPPTLRGLHLMVGAAVWTALVVLIHHSGRIPALAA